MPYQLDKSYQFIHNRNIHRVAASWIDDYVGKKMSPKVELFSIPFKLIIFPLPLSFTIYIYIYIYVCVCVCVCEFTFLLITVKTRKKTTRIIVLKYTYTLIELYIQRSSPSHADHMDFPDCLPLSFYLFYKCYKT